jgi:hypothetical protein
MITLANAESRRVTELVAAYEEHEITTHELCECLAGLSSEVLFVIASYTVGSEDVLPASDRLRLARRVCRQVATSSRSYC